MLETVEEQCPFLQPSLANPKISEPTQRARSDRQTFGEHIECGRKLAFGLGPATGRHENPRIMGAAVARDRDKVAAAHHLLRGSQPLLGSPDVASVLARGEQAAKATFEHRELGDVARAD